MNNFMIILMVIGFLLFVIILLCCILLFYISKIDFSKIDSLIHKIDSVDIKTLSDKIKSIDINSINNTLNKIDPTLDVITKFDNTVCKDQKGIVFNGYKGVKILGQTIPGIDPIKIC